ncbi:MAG: gephyrin-like molybdotransferase Glp [Thermomicrobiaceae bacterium]
MSDELGGHKSNQYRENRPWQDLDQMLSVDEAKARILSSIDVCPSEPVALIDCHGLVLFEDVAAIEDVPPFRNSAMDGYALNAEDVRSATYESPVVLAIVENLPAGRSPERTPGPGEATRIMTGAVMPEGTDSVVRFEETSEARDAADLPSERSATVEICRAPRVGDNVREAGEDIRAGEIVLHAGTILDGTSLGILASVNRPHVLAIRRPKVGILATGDEVVDPGEPISPGQIRNSNNFMLAGLVREAGGDPLVLGVARDTESALRERLEEAQGFDLLLTSGGVSIGDYDVVKDVLKSEGNIDLWQVRIKPGKPMAFGHIRDIPLIGLPGNPVAAYVAFLQFGAPAIRKMRGLKDASVNCERARLLREHENRGHRRHFVRGIVSEVAGELIVEPVPVQGSGVLSSVARANCLFVIPEELDHAPAGLEVDVIRRAKTDW